MARSHFRYTVTDRAGNAIQNSTVTLYLTGTSTLVTDLYTTAVGGSPVASASLVSNAQGEVEGWLSTPKTVDVQVADTSHSAYYSGAVGTLLTWSPFIETVEVTPPPENVGQLDGTQGWTGINTFGTNPVFNDAAIPEAKVASLVSDLASKATDSAVVHKATASTDIGANGLVESNVTSLTSDLAAKVTTATYFLTDTFANRPAAGTVHRLFFATDTKQWFRDDGAAWHEVVMADHAAVNDPAVWLDVRAYASPQAAINAVPLTGGRVFLASGFSFSSTLTVPAGMVGLEIVGVSKTATTLTYTGTGNCISAGSGSGTIRRMSFRRFKLVGNGASSTHGIYTGNSSEFAFDSLWLTNHGTAAINFDGTLASNATTFTHVVRDCYIQGNQGAGIIGSYIQALTLDNTYVSGNTGVGVQVDGIQSFHVLGGAYESNSIGIDVQCSARPSLGVRIESYLENNTTAAVRLGSVGTQNVIGGYIRSRIESSATTGTRCAILDHCAQITVESGFLSSSATEGTTLGHIQVTANATGCAVRNVGYNTVGNHSLVDDASVNPGALAVEPPIVHTVGAAGEPAFANSWVNYGAPFETASFWRDAEGTEHVQGFVKNGTVGQAIFALPAGHLPAAAQRIAVPSAGAYGEVEIQANGNVIANVGSNAHFSLSGISFRAEG